MPGGAPDAAAKDAILKQVWQPYRRRLPLNWHACVKLAIALLWDALDQIRGAALVEGRLPDLNWYGGRRQLFDAAQPGAAGKLQCVPAV